MLRDFFNPGTHELIDFPSCSQVLSLNVYDMQDALNKEDRMAAVTRVMVTATAQVRTRVRTS